MAISLETTELGGGAHHALAATIARLKGGRALAPVAVIVPSNFVGIAARRAVGRQGGIAAVTFLTPYRLAELLGASGVAASGRRPVSTPVIAGAVRAALADQPGHFAGVHTHPATERSLVRAHKALSEVAPSGLAAIANTSSRAADVVRVHRAVAERLADTFSNEQDLVDAAVETMGSGADVHPVLAELGPAILFLPQRLTSSQVRLVRAFSEASDLTVLAGVTAQPDADASVHRSVAALGVDWPGAPREPTARVPRADRGLSVSDADDEVRHALRVIVDATRGTTGGPGTPLGRCAVLYGSRDPYARLLGDAFDAAGIDWFGTSVATADASLLGRSLLALLALPDHDYSRRDVAAWLAGAPIRGADNRPAPVAAWERASRAAGVIAGVDQWTTRLGRLVEELEGDAAQAERDEEQSWRADRFRREAEQASELAAFIEQLNTDLDPGGRAGTWRGLASWCRQLVRTYVGGESLRESWPPDERAAGQRIDAAIDRLGDLDGIDPNPSVAAFRRALELQLADDIGRHGSFGNGVLLGPAHIALGLELDVVVIIGMAEGSFPGRRRDDPLLPDRVRAVLTDQPHDLPTRADLVADDHRALLGVMTAAHHVTMTFPRGDLRRSAERAPSRWLLDTVEAHEGSGVRPAAEALGRATGEWFTEVPSFIAGLRATDFPGHAQEYDVRALLDAADAGNDIGSHSVLAERTELQRGIDLIRGRLSRSFTRFDGNLTSPEQGGDANLRGATLPTPLDPDHTTSATRLETWSKCPHAYFVSHILGVRPVEDPEQEYRITPLTLGNLVHHALEHWIAEALAADAVPAEGGPWSEEARARLLAIANEEAERLANKGLVGRAVYWQRDHQVMQRDLAEVAATMDHHQRSAHGSTPIHTELPFGMPHEPSPPAAITLPSGRVVNVRGSIDRVDETHDGDLIIIDYKTGRSDSRYADYTMLSEETPTPSGKFLQLALYAAAAKIVLDRPDAAVRGAYWFVTRRGGHDTAGYRVTDDVAARALGVVEQIIDGISSGLFPQAPAEPGWRMFVDCDYCEPDGLGTSHQFADFTRIVEHPGLAPWLAVVSSGADPDGEGDA